MKEWILFSVLFTSMNAFSRPENLTEKDFIAHEWGTFTSLQGSDGVNQPGLHHGEEELPDFVFCPRGRNGGRFSYSQCLDMFRPEFGSPYEVTQRMETPIIYFYSKNRKKAQVKVDFPKGVMSEWYPQANFFYPGFGQLEKIGQGTITWIANIAREGKSLQVPEVTEESIWWPSREVDANYVAVSGTNVDQNNEKHIFYRGLGNFDTDLTIKAESRKNIQVKNSSNELIPNVLLLDVRHDGSASYQVLGELKKESTLTITNFNERPVLSQKKFKEEIRSKLAEILEATGLYQDESMAMVNTWTHSYFEKPGLRVLYIMPRIWSDEIIPISITPAPSELVRTMVGRVEVFTSLEETKLLNEVKKGFQANLPNFHFTYILDEHGRIGEPKLWRIHSLTTNKELKTYIENIVKVVYPSNI